MPSLTRQPSNINYLANHNFRFLLKRAPNVTFFCHEYSLPSYTINQVRRTISRLIDAYGDGLLDKSEFEPRVTAARERLSKLEEEHQQRTEEEDRDAELRLVIG